MISMFLKGNVAEGVTRKRGRPRKQPPVADNTLSQQKGGRGQFSKPFPNVSILSQAPGKRPRGRPPKKASPVLNDGPTPDSLKGCVSPIIFNRVQVKMSNGVQVKTIPKPFPKSSVNSQASGKCPRGRPCKKASPVLNDRSTRDALKGCVSPITSNGVQVKTSNGVQVKTIPKPFSKSSVNSQASGKCPRGRPSKKASRILTARPCPEALKGCVSPITSNGVQVKTPNGVQKNTILIPLLQQKRGRGRPVKRLSNFSVLLQVPEKRGRGRPRQQKTAPLPGDVHSKKILKEDCVSTVTANGVPVKAPPRCPLAPLLEKSQKQIQQPLRKCRVCDFASSFYTHMARHELVQHGIIKPGRRYFQCLVCDHRTLLWCDFTRHPHIIGEKRSLEGVPGVYKVKLAGRKRLKANRYQVCGLRQPRKSPENRQEKSKAIGRKTFESDIGEKKQDEMEELNMNEETTTKSLNMSRQTKSIAKKHSSTVGKRVMRTKPAENEDKVHQVKRKHRDIEIYPSKNYVSNMETKLIKVETSDVSCKRTKTQKSAQNMNRSNGEKHNSMIEFNISSTEGHASPKGHSHASLQVDLDLLPIEGATSAIQRKPVNCSLSLDEIGDIVKRLGEQKDDNASNGKSGESQTTNFDWYLYEYENRM